MALKILLLIFAVVAASVHENLARSVENSSPDEDTTRYSFILIGATGDLSKRKIYPALWSLYRDKLLPKDLRIFGYARKQRSVEVLRTNCEPFMTVNPDEKELYDKFWQLSSYVAGTDGGLADYESINRAVEAFENGQKSNRLFYFAVPPAAFESVASNIHAAAMARNGATRVVIEKPFGYDLDSSNKLSEHLASLYREDQIYRIDHYLGYEMVQNLYALRFGNRIFEPTWNHENVAAVKINFAEQIGIEGRGKFFDGVGIIRDVMQNHLLQVMSLIAMEKPKSDNPDDVRDAKMKLLLDTQTITNLSDVVLGQYIANPNSNDPNALIGYRGDETVPDDSITPTFALTVLHVNNDRWNGVPFIIRAGKGLDKKQTQVIIQFKNVTGGLFETQPKRNELIISIKNPQQLQANIESKEPGYSHELKPILVSFNYDDANKNVKIPEPYERLILDIFQGSQLNFVRTDELREAWRIYEPTLKLTNQSQIQPKEYKFGTAGPEEADELERKYDFINQS